MPKVKPKKLSKIANILLENMQSVDNYLLSKQSKLNEKDSLSAIARNLKKAEYLQEQYLRFKSISQSSVDISEKEDFEALRTTIEKLKEQNDQNNNIIQSIKTEYEQLFSETQQLDDIKTEEITPANPEPDSEELEELLTQLELQIEEPSLDTETLKQTLQNTLKTLENIERTLKDSAPIIDKKPDLINQYKDIVLATHTISTAATTLQRQIAAAENEAENEAETVAGLAAQIIELHNQTVALNSQVIKVFHISNQQKNHLQAMQVRLQKLSDKIATEINDYSQQTGQVTHSDPSQTKIEFLKNLQLLEQKMLNDRFLLVDVLAGTKSLDLDDFSTHIDSYETEFNEILATKQQSITDNTVAKKEAKQLALQSHLQTLRLKYNEAKIIFLEKENYDSGKNVDQFDKYLGKLSALEEKSELTEEEIEEINALPSVDDIYNLQCSLSYVADIQNSFEKDTQEWNAQDKEDLAGLISLLMNEKTKLSNTWWNPTAFADFETLLGEYDAQLEAIQKNRASTEPPVSEEDATPEGGAPSPEPRIPPIPPELPIPDVPGGAPPKPPVSEEEEEEEEVSIEEIMAKIGVSKRRWNEGDAKTDLEPEEKKHIQNMLGSYEKRIKYLTLTCEKEHYYEHKETGKTKLTAMRDTAVKMWKQLDAYRAELDYFKKLNKNDLDEDKKAKNFLKDGLKIETKLKQCLTDLEELLSDEKKLGLKGDGQLEVYTAEKYLSSQGFEVIDLDDADISAKLNEYGVTTNLASPAGIPKTEPPTAESVISESGLGKTFDRNKQRLIHMTFTVNKNETVDKHPDPSLRTPVENTELAKENQTVHMVTLQRVEGNKFISEFYFSDVQLKTTSRTWGLGYSLPNDYLLQWARIQLENHIKGNPNSSKPIVIKGDYNKEQLEALFLCGEYMRKIEGQKNLRLINQTGMPISITSRQIKGVGERMQKNTGIFVDSHEKLAEKAKLLEKTTVENLEKNFFKLHK